MGFIQIISCILLVFTTSTIFAKNENIEEDWDLELPSPLPNTDYKLKPLTKIKPIHLIPILRYGNQGNVKLLIMIDEQGNVIRVKTLKSAHPELEKVSVNGLLQSKFPSLPYKIIVPVETKFTAVSTQDDDTLIEFNGIDPYNVPKASKGLPDDWQYDIPPQIKIALPVVYPFDLLKNKIQGTAQVAIVIGADGNVKDTKLIKASQPEFGQAAEASFGSWKFSPAQKDQKNSESLLTREFKFNFKDRDTQPNKSAQNILELISKGGKSIVPVNNLDTVPKALYQPLPVIPKEMIIPNQKNEVLVEFYIDQDGIAQLPRIVSQNNEKIAWMFLTQIMRWQFEKPTLSNKPVIAKIQVPFEVE